ncbi:TetR/AcrR family transcriptional regulator [Rugamonas apoptosis]|uniref:TetR/AcrR family transcriptional regulator n=1 Tax=Rugamonas apoptosis TaxID=2758570 RepID=A0A7W2F6U7_9BURK|nr:TetR/AcrR family transcriptional regulator [Rugamonas apoptosis]MBA5686154.1 TetR/AcrR family transcriptional regulator [Rugamonas apoptosis]
MNTITIRQRLNREQSREQTRERLLEAAHAVIIKKGFALASVEDITAAAGYSRGAFYSNFTDKTELFVELLRRETADIDRDFQQLLGAPLVDAAVLQEKIAGYYSRLYQDDMCSVLWLEAKVVAVRDAEFRATLSEFLKERHERLTEFVTTFFRLAKTPPAAPSHRIAIGLMALCEGMCFAHLCDPKRINDKTVEEVLSWFLKTVIAVPHPSPQTALAAPRVKTRVPAKRGGAAKAK